MRVATPDRNESIAPATEVGARPEEVATLGLDEIFDREAVVLIESGERFLHLMPEDRIEIRLDSLGADDRRISVITAAVC